MTAYVAGFLFDPKLKDVALILKNKGPGNMAGKLNAIGGKIESPIGKHLIDDHIESPLEAMIREFKEETGADVTDWKQFCILHGEGWIVYFFKSFEKDYQTYLQSMTDERVDWYSINSIVYRNSYKIMDNLKWLIPMALDSDVVLASVCDGVPQ